MFSEVKDLGRYFTCEDCERELSGDDQPIEMGAHLCENDFMLVCCDCYRKTQEKLEIAPLSQWW